MESAVTQRLPGPGRPRSYDRDVALDAALNVFWRHGYEAASLEMLTEAMGISRSSFYAAFGSKHAVLIAALGTYAAKARAGLAEAGGTAAELLSAIVTPGCGTRGCLVVNCITELAPHDPEVAALGRAHLAHIEGLFARALDPERPAAALPRARALTALALGVVTLRKSGMPLDQIQAALQAASALAAPPI